MSVDKIKISSLWAIVLAGASSQAIAGAFPNVESMFQAIAPEAAETAPELNSLIIAIDALPTDQQKFDALQTLIPSANGSLRAASEGPMRQMESVLYDRLIKVKKVSGVSSGDETVKTESTVKTAADPEAVDPKAEAQKVEAHKAHAHKAEVNKAEAHKAVDPKAKDHKGEAAKGEPAKEEATKVEAAKVEATKVEETKGEENKAEGEPPVEPPKEINKGVWIQLLGNNTGQDFRNSVPGYDANVLGLLIGRDKLVTPNLTVGLAIGYVHADVDSRGPSGSTLDIKRFQGTLYAGYHFESPFFLHGSFTVAKNDYDNERYILVPPVGGVPFVRIAWSDFNAVELDGHLETGYVWQCGHFRATPKVMLSYSFFNFEKYVESDAFGLDLFTRYHNMNFMPLGLGVKLEYQNEFERVYVVPEIHAYGFHDFINDAQTATALFTGGGFEFLSQGATPAANSIEVGAGLAVHSDTNIAVVIQYDYAARNEYHRNQAFIKVRYEWA